MFRKWKALKQIATRWMMTLSKKEKKQRRVYEDVDHPIRHENIRSSAWAVIWKLKRQGGTINRVTPLFKPGVLLGFEAFFVGGTVRDLCLNLPPKDIDIVTSAELYEVKRLFHRSIIVGKRFPICLVFINSEQIEVSSFFTTVDQATLPPHLDKIIHGSRVKDRWKSRLPVTWSMVRQLNAANRDFSVNALMYEPATQLLFDYVNGYNDLKDRRLRCLKDPSLSFMEDPARILRAIRFASRLELKIDNDLGKAMKDHAKLLLTLPQPRAQLELNNILAHGSASLAFKLMWKYGVIDWILPVHAEYFEKQGYKRNEDFSEDSEYFFRVLHAFDELKRHYSPMQPHTCTVAIAAPLIAHNIQQLGAKLADSSSDNDEEKVSWLRKQSEDVGYKSIVMTTMESISRTKGNFSIIPKGAMLRAQEIFQQLKTKHLQESDEEVFDFEQKDDNVDAFSLLETEKLDWQTKSTLGLKLIKPNRSSIEID